MKPKRPILKADWADPQPEWEANKMEDCMRLQKYADDIDAWLTEEVLVKIRSLNDQIDALIAELEEAHGE